MVSKRKIAKNTIIQYIRLIISVLVGLYSVRLILNALGVNDYGIYDVVSGIIVLFGFIQASVGQTSIRYISVSLGESNSIGTKETFRRCFWMHVIISVILVVILEIIGISLIDHFLTIPSDRLNAARIVFQCMILSLFLNIISTPFQALIIAHEEFLVTALISILDSFLKLSIAFFITVATGDKLIIYAMLMAIVTIVNFILYYFYNLTRHRSEFACFPFSFKGLKQVSQFAGWTLLDVFGTVATRQGYSIILNKFIGPSANAVFAIARHIEGQLYNVSGSVIDTMKPQIMISHGNNDEKLMFKLSFMAGKLGYSMMALIAIPIIVLMPDVLTLWLKNVPEGAAEYSRLLIVACMMEQLTRGLVYANQAQGNIKWFCIIISVIRFSALPISCALLYMGFSGISAIIVFVICETLGSLSRLLVMKILSDIDVKSFFTSVVAGVFPPTFISFVICIIAYRNEGSIINMALSSVASIIVYIISFYYFGLSIEERRKISSRIYISKN